MVLGWRREDAGEEAKGTMLSRCCGSRLGSSCKIVLVLLTLSVPSASLIACSVRTWHYRGRCESFMRLPRANRVDARDDGKMHSSHSSSDPSRSGEVELEEMELWLDETGIDRRGGGKVSPSAKLRRFPGRGIGLEAAVDLQRDSTVRHKMTPLVRAVFCQCVV